jgi:hypothetical protein
MTRHLRRLMLGLLGLLVLHGSAYAQTAVESGIKAAYLVRFGLYVEWPASAFAGPNAALILCVVGDDPFGEQLDRAAADRPVNGRALQVRRLRRVVRDGGCHMVYVGDAPGQHAAQVIDAVRGQPVLTVTDAARGAQTVGIVHFVVRDDRVRFEIDDEAAATNGLQISSKLLGLALKVRPRAR